MVRHQINPVGRHSGARLSSCSATPASTP